MNKDLLIPEGFISYLPSERQEKIKNLSQELKKQIEENGEDGLLAFTMTALEIQKIV